MIRKAHTIFLLGLFGLSVLTSGFVFSHHHLGEQVNPLVHYSISADSNYTTLLGGSSIEDATKVAFDQEGNVAPM